MAALAALLVPPARRRPVAAAALTTRPGGLGRVARCESGPFPKGLIRVDENDAHVITVKYPAAFSETYNQADMLAFLQGVL
jgi:hypothetical protein